MQTVHSLNIKERISHVDDSINELEDGIWTLTNDSTYVAISDVTVALRNIWRDILSHQDERVVDMRVREYGDQWLTLSVITSKLIHHKYKKQAFQEGNFEMVKALEAADEALHKVWERAEALILRIEAEDDIEARGRG